MTTLLGIPDQRIGNSKTDFTTNKIGGRPDWTTEDCHVPLCGECKRVMYLTVQLYCPLDGSLYHRTIYLFTCLNKLCWNKPHSWKAVRCQQIDKSFSRSSEGNNIVQKDTDDWGVKVDDWGTDVDDWGDCDMTSAFYGQGEGQATIEGEAQDHINYNDHNCADDEKSKVSDINYECCKEISGSSPTTASSSQCSVDMDMDKLNIHDVEDDDNVPSVVMVDDRSAMVTKEGVDQMMRVLACRSSIEDTDVATHVTTVGEADILEAYYMNVFEEQDSVLTDEHHIQRLLKDYQRTEGVRLEDIICEQGSSGSGGEKYEKDDIVHGDKYFHKFTKKIAACPEQCVRYHWDGKPLYIARPEQMASPACAHCGGKTVYELQLMPALVNLLHFHNSSEHTTEFGTVLVYSCSVSCWQDGEIYRQESVYVQDDPDSHLFRK